MWVKARGLHLSEETWKLRGLGVGQLVPADALLTLWPCRSWVSLGHLCVTKLLLDLVPSAFFCAPLCILYGSF